MMRVVAGHGAEKLRNAVMVAFSLSFGKCVRKGQGLGLRQYWQDWLEDSVVNGRESDCGMPW